jgi:hypothetical protein
VDCEDVARGYTPGNKRYVRNDNTPNNHPTACAVIRTQGSAIRALDIGVMLNSVCMHMRLETVRMKYIPLSITINLTSLACTAPSIGYRTDLAQSAKIAALSSVRLLCISRCRYNDGPARDMLHTIRRYNSSRATPMGILASQHAPPSARSCRLCVRCRFLIG